MFKFTHGIVRIHPYWKVILVRIRQVDFPAAVLEAQRSGQLVIFAGAGVSMDPPSNYPNFNTLAEQVGGAAYPRLEEEAIDRYLGRVKGVGVKVHELVRSILSSPDSKPNALHEALVGIFETPEKLRIVTTNFDTHFTMASRQRFTDKFPEVFCAPALPLGGEFNGIVHIHGSVDKPAGTLVLTDSDFGRAYITEGYATRFLERLFARYLVLFVGYSHEDMLLSYLARGLTAGSPGPGRFALTLPGDDNRWQNLGITPFHYPMGAPPQTRHFELSRALTAWAEQSRGGALAAEQRIQAIVTAGVPLEQEDLDYVQHALSDLSTVRFFTRYAKNPEWLTWMEGQSSFQQLFRLSAEYSEIDLHLASWFAENFVSAHSEQALDLLRRNNVSLSPWLWQAIALTLFRQKPESAVLAKWVPVLIASAVQPKRNDVLEYILEKCVYPDDVSSALVLLEYLTRPTIKLERSIKWSDIEAETREVTRATVDCMGSDHWLTRAWSAFFSPHMKDFVVPLASMVTSHLTSARNLLVSFGKAGGSWDPISYSRGMVESRPQDHLHSGVSVLVDIAAAVMKWATENDQQLGAGLIAQWSISDSSLLKRLALYGVSLARHVSADEKLAQLVREKLLFAPGLKHELFLVMASAYPAASANAREQFLEEVLKGTPPKEAADEETREIREYEVFNVLVWIKKKAPECPLVTNALASLREKHPDYGERDHPDLDHWIGPVTAGGWGEADLSLDLADSTLEQLQKKLAEAPDNPYPRAKDSKQRIMSSIGDSARTSPDWGFEIAKQAQAASEWSSDIWQPLVGAWQSLELSGEQWELVINILSGSQPVFSETVRDLASLLERGVQSTTSPIPVPLIERAKSLADQLREFAIELQSAVSGESVDWLQRAINHPMGHLAEFYLHALSRLNRAEAIDSSILSGYQSSLMPIVTGTSYGDQLGRVVLASQLHFLFRLDEQWTLHEIFPLLDAQLSLERASQCWQGFLCWGRWSDAMLPNLLPLYERMFTEITKQSEEVQRSFCGHLAGIAVYAVEGPLQSGWLFRCLKSVPVSLRALWAGQVHSAIQRLEPIS